MVVGNGPSGTDIAVAAGQAAADGFAYLSIRSGVDLRPRYPYGINRHGWMLISERLPPHLCESLMERISALKYNLEDFGVWEAPPQTGSAVGYRGPELLNALREGQVVPVRHPLRFDARGAHLADGELSGAGSGHHGHRLPARAASISRYRDAIQHRDLLSRFRL